MTPRVALVFLVLIVPGCLSPLFPSEGVPTPATTTTSTQVLPPTIVKLDNRSWPSLAASFDTMEVYLENQSAPDHLPAGEGSGYVFYKSAAGAWSSTGSITVAASGARIAYSILLRSNFSRAPDSVWPSLDKANVTEAQLVQSLALDDDSICRAVAGRLATFANYTGRYVMSLEEQDPRNLMSPFMGNAPSRIAELHVASILKDAECPPLQPPPTLVDWALDIVARAKAIPDHPDEPSGGDLPHDNPKHQFIEAMKLQEWAVMYNLTRTAHLLALEAAEWGYYLVYNETRDAMKDAPSFEEIADLAARLAPTIPPDSFQAWEYGSATYTYNNAATTFVRGQLDDPPFRWKAFVALAQASGDPGALLDALSSNAPRP